MAPSAFHSSALEQAQQSIFPFNELPAELQDVILVILIASGNLEILRTCRQYHGKAPHFHYKHGVFRMDARNQSGDIHPFIECLRDKIITPDRLCAIQYKSLFQNLEIRCDNEHLYNFWYPLVNFDEPGWGCGEHCYIVLNIQTYGKTCLRSEQIAVIFKGLEGFKTVTTTVKSREFPSAPKPETDSVRYPVVVRAFQKPVYKMFRDVYEPILRPATSHESGNVEGRYLEFHPRDFQKTLNKDVRN